MAHPPTIFLKKIRDYTIGKNISLACEIQGKTPTSAQIDEALDKVGLNGFAKRQAKTLSGGQKQRIAIARALIKDTKVLLSDEPTGALDRVTGQEIFQLLRKLSQEKLVVVVSHDVQSAEQYADRIIEISDGVIIDDRENAAGTETATLNIKKLDQSIYKEINDYFEQGKSILIKLHCGINYFLYYVQNFAKCSLC